MWSHGNLKHLTPDRLIVIGLAVATVDTVSVECVATLPIAKPIIPASCIEKLLRHAPDVLAYKVQLRFR